MAPGRVGNGVTEYEVPLGSGAFREGALGAENLVTKGEDGFSPAVHVKDGNKPGVLVLRMASSYVYLSGELMLDVGMQRGSVKVSISTNNGLDWREVKTLYRLM